MIPINWNVISSDRNVRNEIAYDLEIPVAAASVYVNRGLVTAEKAQDFCSLGIHKLHDPWLLPDMDVAVKRLYKAIKNNEHIHVHGDYDVDGITSVAVIAHTLKKLKANLTYEVPHRIHDGYDIQPKTIEKAKENKVDLLISVDCGTLAFEAAKKAKELGIDLIITDHHIPNDDGSLPDCVAVINPRRLDSKYPCQELAGVGVAFKFMLALMGYITESNDESAYILEVIDYVALGTVADVAPMVDENRSMVHLGCLELVNSKKTGISNLLKVAGINFVNTTSIGFFVAPRINAVGRLAESKVALDLMLETNNIRANFLANQLDIMNKRRQDKQEQVVEEAKALLPEDLSDTSIIVVAAKSWHPGVIGLVAGKLAEEYARPALVCSIDSEGNAKGSCRSTRDFHILNALKSPGCLELFRKVGGHAFAAGFELSADKIPQLREKINEYAKQVTRGGIKAVKNIDIDFRIDPLDVGIEIFNAISKLSPFGIGNPEPTFLVSKVKILSVDTVGSGKHLKLKLKVGKYDNQWLTALWWRHGDMSLSFPIDSLVDIVFRFSMEEYLGRTNLTMIIEDMKLI